MEKEGIRDFLLSKGFKPFRQVYDGVKLVLMTSKESFMNDDTFSTMVKGGLVIFYIKDDLTVTYGLGEHGKPPMLLYPYPKCSNNIDRLGAYDVTERLIKKYSNEEIFNAMFDEKVFLEL
jgi:hypothetical protein